MTVVKIFLLALTLSSLVGAAAQTLTVYSGHNEEFIEPVVADFEAETGHQVAVLYGDTGEMATLLLERGGIPADVFLAQNAGALGTLAQAGRFARLPDDVLDRVEARFRSPDGFWVGVTGRVRVAAYNTDNVAEAELPASVFALTEPEWRGRVGWAPENGSFQAFVSAMRLVEGEARTRGWLASMVANGVRTFPDNSAQLEALGRGELDLGLVNHYYLHRYLAEEGDDFPVRNHYFADADLGTLANVTGVGVLAEGRNLEVAEQLVAYLLTRDAQQHFTTTVYEYPLISGVETNVTLEPLTDIVTPELNLADLGLAGTPELLEEVGAFAP